MRVSRRASVSGIQIADRDADGSMTCQAVEIDHHQRRPQVRHGLCEIGDRAQAVDEQFAVRQAGEIVMHAVVQHAFFGVLASVTSVSVPTTRHFAVRADHRPRER
jgi:hypothetical protein